MFSDATFTKKTFKYCYKEKYPPNGYNNVEEAKTACENDDICGKVYDKNCDNVGPFYLCPFDSPEYGSMSSCIYVKDSIGNFISNLQLLQRYRCYILYSFMAKSDIHMFIVFVHFRRERN